MNEKFNVEGKIEMRKVFLEEFLGWRKGRETLFLFDSLWNNLN